MIFVQEFRHNINRVSIKFLNPLCRVCHRYQPWSYICQIQIKPIFLISVFGTRYYFSQKVHKQQNNAYDKIMYKQSIKCLIVKAKLVFYCKVNRKGHCTTKSLMPDHFSLWKFIEISQVELLTSNHKTLQFLSFSYTDFFIFWNKPSVSPFDRILSILQGRLQKVITTWVCNAGISQINDYLLSSSPLLKSTFCISTGLCQSTRPKELKIVNFGMTKPSNLSGKWPYYLGKLILLSIRIPSIFYLLILKTYREECPCLITQTITLCYFTNLMNIFVVSLNLIELSEISFWIAFYIQVMVIVYWYLIAPSMILLSVNSYFHISFSWYGIIW